MVRYLPYDLRPQSSDGFLAITQILVHTHRQRLERAQRLCGRTLLRGNSHLMLLLRHLMSPAMTGSGNISAGAVPGAPRRLTTVVIVSGLN